MARRAAAAAQLAAAVALLLSSSAAAGDEPRPVLTILESDAAGGSRTLNDDVRIADINSVLEIEVDREALRERIAQQLGEASDLSELIQTANMLNRLAEEGLDALPDLEAALAAWDEPAVDDAQKKMMGDALQKVAEAALGILAGAGDLEAVTRINTRFNQALTDMERGSFAEQYRALFEIAADVAGELARGVDEELKRRGVFIQLGGWLRAPGEDRPLHLPGFDSYEPGERFVVDRFNWALTPEQEKQLADAAKDAAEINARGAQALIDLRGRAEVALDTLTTSLRGCLDDLESGLEGLHRDPALADLSDWADAARTLVRDFRGRLLLVREQSREGAAASSPDRFLPGIQGGAQALIEDGSRLVKHLQQLEPKLQSLAAGARVPAAWATFREGVVTQCQARLQAARDELLGPLASMIASTKAARQIGAHVLEFGEQVHRFDIESLPAKAILDLVYTGRREPGSVVDLVLAAGRAGSKESRQVIERRTVPLFRTLSYLALNVSVIMGNPEGELPSGRKFQAGPSYSMLFKRDSRKSVIYNRLFNPGFGVNLAAFDFDGDDTVELGAGAVIAVMSDFLQVGYGYNFGVDRWYSFIGLRLPVGMKQVPLGQADKD